MTSIFHLTHLKKKEMSKKLDNGKIDIFQASTSFYYSGHVVTNSAEPQAKPKWIPYILLKLKSSSPLYYCIYKKIKLIINQWYIDVILEIHMYKLL